MHRSTLAPAACALVWTLAACAGPTASGVEEVEQGSLLVGRKCQLQGVRYTLDARFDVAGPDVVELDTGLTSDAPVQLAAGSYVITIRPDFTLWRDIAVAQVQVTAQLVSDAQQQFEITSGTSTLVAYEFIVDGETAAFDAD